MADLVKVKLMGVEDVAAEYRDIAKNQLPYANALALTKTSRDAQDHIRGNELPQHFTLRRAAWIKGNVKQARANKNDSPPTAVVEDTFNAMGLQETGGTKIPFGKYIAVPLSGARRNVRSLIDANNSPEEVMKRGGFIRNNAQGIGIMYDIQLKAGRRGRLSRAVGGIQRAAQWTREIVPMYALVSRVQIKPRYGFVPGVEQVVRSNFPKNFQDAFAQAVRTAKK